LAILRKRSRAVNKLPMRRRSFDYAENRDFETGITEALGYEFEEPYNDQMQKSDFTTFSSNVTKVMATAGLSITDDMKWAMDSEDMASYLANAAERAKVEEQRRAIREGKAPTVSRWGKKENEVIVWQEHYSDEGYTFYFKESTGESQYDAPTGDNIQIEVQHQDDQGHWFWFNQTTQESKWVSK
jgi:hypothetical protein